MIMNRLAFPNGLTNSFERNRNSTKEDGLQQPMMSPRTLFEADGLMKDKNRLGSVLPLGYEWRLEALRFLGSLGLRSYPSVWHTGDISLALGFRQCRGDCQVESAGPPHNVG